MKHRFRLLKSGPGTAEFNMGLDQAILEAVSRGLVLPTLRLYSWEPSAVSIGYFQGMNEEVDVEVCRKNAVSIVRRITGGGAVFHQHELTYSIVLPEEHPLAVKSIEKSYAIFCSALIKAFGILGIQAEFAPINDILVEGKKISGNAQTRKFGCILQHGTILIRVDVDRMFELLKVPSEKSRGKLIQDVKKRITSIEQLLDINPSYEEIESAVEAGFREALELDYTNQKTPTSDEVQRAESLAVSRFSSDEWNFRR